MTLMVQTPSNLETYEQASSFNLETAFDSTWKVNIVRIYLTFNWL